MTFFAIWDWNKYDNNIKIKASKIDNWSIMMRDWQTKYIDLIKVIRIKNYESDETYLNWIEDHNTRVKYKSWRWNTTQLH